jgi:sulfite dehydrogenase
MSPIGVKGSPDFPPVWEMPPKSWINIPSDPDKSVKAGLVQISGVAMGGMDSPKSIEVSINGGKDWHSAKFVGPDLGKYAWREFVFSTKLAPGKYELASRTTSVNGQSQPEERIENNRGYVANGWRDHMVVINVT